jgi:CHAT domain-containing protein
LPAGGSSLSDFYPDGMTCTPSAAYYASATTATPKSCLAVAVGDDLPHLSRELAQLRIELGDVTVVEGSRAKLSEVARLASGVDIFYYMGHGAIAEGDDVLQAKLLLADGVLSTYDLFSGRLQLARGATAILNCCDVGRTAAGTAGEMMGFARGLFHAGASAVVTALWPLDDKIAATMMPSVVASLRRGAGLAAAMTRAIREVKSDPENKNPYYWAPYQWWGK